MMAPLAPAIQARPSAGTLAAPAPSGVMQTGPSPPASPPDRPAGARLAGRIDRLQRRVTDLTKAMPLPDRLGAGAQQALLSAVGSPEEADAGASADR